MLRNVAGLQQAVEVVASPNTLGAGREAGPPGRKQIFHCWHMLRLPASLYLGGNGTHATASAPVLAQGKVIQTLAWHLLAGR
jgi:hypothetical protein